MFVNDSSCRVEGAWSVRNNMIKYALLDIADVTGVGGVAVTAAAAVESS